MLLGFKKRFVEPILIGTKVHTMRKDRRVQPKIGERLYMYTGLRTSSCQKITDKEILISTQRVHIKGSLNLGVAGMNVWIDGRNLSNIEINEFVKFDGFTDQTDFASFWLEGKKNGRFAAILTLYHWTDLRY